MEKRYIQYSNNKKDEINQGRLPGGGKTYTQGLKEDKHGFVERKRESSPNERDVCLSACEA